jgi:protein TonB
MRLFISFIIGILISLSIFIGMERMTSSKDMKQLEREDIPQLVYLRDKKDSHVDKKKRIKPKKPKIEKIKKVDFKQPKMKTKITKNVKIQPIVTKNIDLSAISSLTGAQINADIGLIDANTLMTLSKVYPKYPRRAKLQRKEGLVQLQFQIDVNGYVHNITIVKSKPQGLFDKSAVNALKKWRFKPIKDSDAGALIDATITFNYRLSK